MSVNQAKRSSSQPKKTTRRLEPSAILEDIEKQQKEEIREVFELFDSEQKGYIQGKNFKICLKTLGIEIKTKDIAPLLVSEFKKSIDSSFKFDEFYKFTKKKLDEKDPDEEMGKAFDLICSKNSNNEGEDNDIKMTHESLSKLAKEVGETLTNDEIEEMVNIVGIQGEISKDNFISFMKNPLSYNKNLRSSIE